jgi:hypothetical protein
MSWGGWQGRVEELGDHRDEPGGALNERHMGGMSGAGKRRELGTGQTDEIAGHPTAEQAQQRDRVLGTDDSRATA